MRQAVHLGDRILMMHRGRIIHDFQHEEKRLHAGDLVELFDEVRRKEQIDPAIARMLERNYV
jgi:putative ABC transport system ATP-binding protein